MPSLPAALHVLLVTHQAPPHIGGVENLVDLEARALAAEGHTATWVASRPAGEQTPWEYPAGVTLVRVPAWHLFERWIKVAYPLFSPSLVTTLWREAGRADVVHVHGFVFLSSVVAVLVAACRQTPVVLTDHGGLLRLRAQWATWLLRLAAATLGRITCRGSSRLVAYNQTVHDLLARLAGTDARCLFLPNPVDHTRFRPPTAEERARARAELGWADDRRVVLFVGRLVEHKGMGLLLAARDPAFDLAFCGPGDPSSILPHVGPGVSYLPPRPQAEVIKLYHAADLLALPSYNEGFPVVIQEALSCGLPVVTSEDDAYRPYRGTRGLHFCPLDPPQIRAAILSALESTPQSALAADPAALAALFPTRAGWLEQLFGGLVRAAERSPGAAPPS